MDRADVCTVIVLSLHIFTESLLLCTWNKQVKRSPAQYIVGLLLVLGIGDFHAGILSSTHSVLVYIDYSQLGHLRT